MSICLYEILLFTFFLPFYFGEFLLKNEDGISMEMTNSSLGLWGGLVS